MKKSRNRRKPREDRKVSAFEERKKFCPFSQINSPVIDYKDIKLMTRYLSEKGKMIPRRITNVSRIKQKELSTAIKRARFLSLLSYTKTNHHPPLINSNTTY